MEPTAEQSGEYFGLMDICGKGASFMGTSIVSGVSQLTGDINKGVGMIAVLFVIGAICFHMAVKEGNPEEGNTPASDVVSELTYL